MSSGSLIRWTAHNTADGTLFYPPEGKLVAGIQVRERLRPLEPVKTLVAQVQQQLAPTVTIDTVGPIEALQTREGEHAALVALSGTTKAHAQPFRYTLACVFGDDFYDRIDGYYADTQRVAEYQELTREFILNYRLNLGENRARRFYYVPPPATWQGRARGLLAQWFTYDFPKRPSQILVSASFPSTQREASVTARVMLQRRLIGFRIDEEKIEAVKHPLDFDLQLHHAHGAFAKDSPMTDLLTTVMTDQHHVYVVRLETTAAWLEADRAVLLDLARSVRPVPRRAVNVQEVMSWMVE